MTDNCRVIVVGLGNPLLGDDGFGWRVAEQIQYMVQGLASATEVDCLAVGGLRLMERLIGYDRAIIIDAITSGKHPPGEVLCFSAEVLPVPAVGHFSSSHDMTFQTALQLGRTLGLHLPEEIWIVGVEATFTYDFSEALTPSVAAAVARVHQIVMDLSVEERQYS